MILIGQYDSPFVRRVGIALTLYGLPFEHRPWSIFGDADKIRAYNPLMRVPTLVLDDGEVLIESHSILDYLDSLVPADRAHVSDRRAGAASGAEDRRARHRTGRQGGQPVLRKAAAQGGLGGLGRRAAARRFARVLAALEADRAGADRRLLVRRPHRPRRHRGRGGAALHRRGASGLVAMAQFPALAAHAARLEALPAFQTISQPFIPPA